MDLKGKREGPNDWHQTGDIVTEQGKGDPFAAAIRATRMAMIITDPRRDDNPIIFVNEAFLRLSGYSRDEVIGRNCRFLQGSETDRDTVTRIRACLAAGQDINVDILNYTKQGEKFWNALYISPVFAEDGELQFHFSSQIDISDRKQLEDDIRAEKERVERAVTKRTVELQAALDAQKALLHEVDHRVKNNLQMVSSLIVMQSRTIPDEGVRASLRTMLERVEALSTVHRRLYQSDDVTRFDIAAFARDLVDDLVAASGRKIETRLDLEPVEVTAERAAPVALIVNELVTNSIKHAFSQERSGILELRVSQAGGICTIEVRDDGPGMPPEVAASSFGMKLIRSIGRQLNAEIDWKDGSPGTRVVLTMPLTAADGAGQT